MKYTHFGQGYSLILWWVLATKSSAQGFEQYRRYENNGFEVEEPVKNYLNGPNVAAKEKIQFYGDNNGYDINGGFDEKSVVKRDTFREKIIQKPMAAKKLQPDMRIEKIPENVLEKLNDFVPNQIMEKDSDVKGKKYIHLKNQSILDAGQHRYIDADKQVAYRQRPGQQMAGLLGKGRGDHSRKVDASVAEIVALINSDGYVKWIEARFINDTGRMPLPHRRSRPYTAQDLTLLLGPGMIMMLPYCIWLILIVLSIRRAKQHRRK